MALSHFIMQVEPQRDAPGSPREERDELGRDPPEELVESIGEDANVPPKAKGERPRRQALVNIPNPILASEKLAREVLLTFMRYKWRFHHNQCQGILMKEMHRQALGQGPGLYAHDMKFLEQCGLLLISISSQPNNL